eukprot:5664545-Ditylum_brightwellii.AAC.1
MKKVEDSKFYSPTVTDIRPDVRTKEIKGDIKGWVQVDVVSVEYKPVIDLNLDKFKEDDTEIQFGVRKEQCGPMVYDELPTVGSILTSTYLIYVFLTWLSIQKITP